MSKPTYPLSAANGTLKLTSDYGDRVKEAILAAVLTYKEERVWRPEYGRSYRIFDSYDLPKLLTDARQAIEAGLENYSGVQIQVYGHPSDEGTVDLTVFYVIPGEQKETLSVTLV